MSWVDEILAERYRLQRAIENNPIGFQITDTGIDHTDGAGEFVYETPEGIRFEVRVRRVPNI